MRNVGAIPDQYVDYSSEINPQVDSQINGTAWTPDLNDKNPNVTVYFPTTAIVNAILVQGGGINDTFLEKFTVKVKNVDGQWEDINDINGNPMVRTLTALVRVDVSKYVTLRYILSMQNDSFKKFRRGPLIICY